MNNLKKVGLTALGTALVATSATAADYSISGTSSVTLNGNDNNDTGNGWSMSDSITFSASGEMDNGMSVTHTYEVDGGAQGFHAVAVDTGDFGTLTFVGGSSTTVIGSWDDLTPTANEEAHGSIGGTEALGKGAGSDGWWKYSNSSMMDGLAVDLGYTPSGSTEFEGTVELGLTYTGVDGLTVGLATGENKAAEGATVDNMNVYMTYAMENGFTIGFQSNESDSQTALADVDDASILEPFSNSSEPLFQDITPCCNHFGKCSYASCSRPNKSLAVAALFASIAILTLGLNSA